jgi:hypothetical protein
MANAEMMLMLLAGLFVLSQSGILTKQWESDGADSILL